MTTFAHSGLINTSAFTDDEDVIRRWNRFIGQVDNMTSKIYKSGLLRTINKLFASCCTSSYGYDSIVIKSARVTLRFAITRNLTS